MKCPQCVEQGKSSCCYERSMLKTLMSCVPFYDADGKRHYHDLNHETRNYSCSNGHQWSEKVESTCWCGWRPSDG